MQESKKAKDTVVCQHQNQNCSPSECSHWKLKFPKSSWTPSTDEYKLPYPFRMKFQGQTFSVSQSVSVLCVEPRYKIGQGNSEMEGKIIHKVLQQEIWKMYCPSLCHSKITHSDKEITNRRQNSDWWLFTVHFQYREVVAKFSLLTSNKKLQFLCFFPPPYPARIYLCL